MKTISRKINFVGKSIAESTSCFFFVIILNIIFTPLTGIKIFGKLLLELKKNYRRSIFTITVINYKILSFFKYD